VPPAPPFANFPFGLAKHILMLWMLGHVRSIQDRLVIEGEKAGSQKICWMSNHRAFPLIGLSNVNLLQSGAFVNASCAMLFYVCHMA